MKSGRVIFEPESSVLFVYYMSHIESYLYLFSCGIVELSS